MKKKLTFGWIIILILSILSFAFYFTKGNLLNYVLKPYLETLISSELNLKATIRKLDISLFRASLNIFEVTLTDVGQPPTERTLVKIPEIRAGLALHQLLLGNLALDTARVKNPSISWVISQSQSRAKPKQFAFSWTPVLRFNFNKILVEGASIEINGPSLHVQHPDLSCQLSLKRGRKYALSLKSSNSQNKIKGFSAGADQLLLDGSLSLPLKVDGKITLSKVMVQSHIIPEIVATFAYEPGQITIRDSLISTPISDLAITASLRFSRLFDLQSGALTVNSIPFRLLPKHLDDKEFYTLESQEVDLSKIFTKNIKLSGFGSLHSKIVLEKNLDSITGSLHFNDVSVDTLYVGSTDMDVQYGDDKLLTQIRFVHPQKNSGGKIEMTIEQKKALRGEGSVEVTNFYLGPESFALIQFPFTFSEEDFSIPSWTIRKKEGQITGSFGLNRNHQILAKWTSRGLTLEEFDSTPSILKGPIEFRGTIDGPISQLNGLVQIDIPHTTIESQDLGPSSVKGVVKSSSLDFTSSLLGGQISQKGSLQLFSTAYHLDTSFDQLDFVPYFKIYHKRIFDFHGSTTGSFNIQGTLLPSQVEKGLLEITSLSFSSGQFSYENKNTLKLEMRHKEWNLKPFVLVGTQTLLTLQGRKNEKSDLNISLEGPFNFHLLQLFFPDVEKSSGEAKVSARMEGPKQHPMLFGTMTVEHGALKTAGFPQMIDDLSLSVSFSQNKISIDKFKGLIGNGDLDIFGSITLLPNQKNPKVDLFTKLDHCSLQYPSWISSTISGELQLSGPQPPYNLEGHLLVHDALYKDNLDWQSKIFSWQKERYLPKTQGIETPDFKFNIDIDIPRNLFVRNNIAKLETKANLKLTGSNLSPHVLGSIDLISGSTFFKGNEFTMTSAQIRFDHPYEINPSFVIHAESAIKNYRVYLSVDGTLSKYNVHLSSDPLLQESDVVSLLTFGATRSEIEKQGVFDVTSLELGSLLFGGVQEKFQSETQKSLGFTFMLSPSYSDTKHATVPRIFIGRSVGKKIDTTFSSTLDKTAIFTDKEFNIKFNINRNLSLLGIWEDISDEALEDNSSLGLDLKAQFEFQ